jgi:hypothetical protein
MVFSLLLLLGGTPSNLLEFPRLQLVFRNRKVAAPFEEQINNHACFTFLARPFS